MQKKLMSNPFILVLYFSVAALVIGHVFVSGYWLGRAQQILEDTRPAGVAAVSSLEP